MSIAKKTKDIYGKKDTDRKKINFSAIIEVLMLICVVVTSVTVTQTNNYWFVPVFFSVAFLLIQVRKLVNHKVKKEEKRKV